MGRVRYLVFYILCGLAAAATQALLNPSSAMPMVGASGAISGVMGGYIVLYPRVQVHMLIFLVVFVTRIVVPAYGCSATGSCCSCSAGTASIGAGPGRRGVLGARGRVRRRGGLVGLFRDRELVCSTAPWRGRCERPEPRAADGRSRTFCYLSSDPSRTICMARMTEGNPNAVTGGLDLPFAPRNPGIPLDLDWVRDVRVNRSAVERRAATLRHPPHGQEGVAGGLAAPRHHPDGPDHALGRRHARPRAPALRQGAPAGARTTCSRRSASADLRSHVGAVCVYHAFVETAVEALRRQRHPGRGRLDRLPGRASPLRRSARGDRGLGRGRRRARSTSSSRARTCSPATGTALYDEVRAFREACGDAHIKAILATGELGTLRNVARASLVCMMAGADFIKTSTGKEAVNATLPVGARDGARDPRVPRAHRLPGRLQAGRRHPHRQAGARLAGLMKEELGDRWLAARPVPLRRERAADRHRAPARALRHRPLLGRVPPPDGADGSERNPAIQRMPEIFETMDYGPAPEAAAPRQRVARRARRAASAISSTATGSRRRRRVLRQRSTRPPASRSPRSRRRRAEDVDAAVRGRARGASPAGARSAATARARYLYALARQIQKHCAPASPCWRRSTTASRSARSRDIDIPLVARHFYHHAGWAQLHGARAPGLRAGGRGRPDHPVELPAADAGLEDRARRSRWATRSCSSRPSSPRSPRCCSPRSAARRGLPPGVVNIVTGDGAHRRGARRASRTSTRSPSPARPRSGRIIRDRHRRQRQEALARAGRQVALHRLRRRRPRQRGRRRGRRDLVQPGPGLLRRLAPAGAGGHRRSG